jgi:hypothetical protein
MGGLQTQYAPTAYIGLWSRVAGFERDQLTRALERRSVVQGTLMRATMHMVSRHDYPLFAAGVRDARRAWWLGLTRRGLDARTLLAKARHVRSLLAHGPLSRTEIMERLGLNTVMWNGVGMFVDLVRVPPSGTWERRRADVFATAEHWLGPTKATREDGIEHVVRRYLEGFGPASRRDVASFTGLSQRALASALIPRPPDHLDGSHQNPAADVAKRNNIALVKPAKILAPRCVGPRSRHGYFGSMC